MSYTNVAKPTSSVYSLVNPVGKQIYDDVNTEYDSSSSSYDGTESGVYTNISKPTSSIYTKIAKPT